MSAPVVLLIADDKLLSAEMQDLRTHLNVPAFETVVCAPSTAEAHEREIERHRPIAVILPRKPLNSPGKKLDFRVSARAATLAQHLRFAYERETAAHPKSRRLRRFESERATL